MTYKNGKVKGNGIPGDGSPGSAMTPGSTPGSSRLHGAVVDITRRLQQETALAVQAHVLEHIGQGVNYVDESGLIRYTNPAFDTMFGYGAGELIGKPVAILNALEPAANERFVERVMATLKSGHNWSGEVSNRRKDGSQFLSSVTLTPVRFQGSTYFVSLHADISRQKETEVELQTQAAMLNLAHDAILVRDPDGTVIFWNRGCAELYGHHSDQAVGRKKQELLRTEFPRPRLEIEAEFYRTGHWEGELIHSCSDGRKVIVASRWAFRDSRNGSPGMILEINRDITHRRQAEESLRRAHADLSGLSRRMITLQEEERRRLARELHDEIGQALTAVRLNLAAMTATDERTRHLRSETAMLLEGLMDQVRTLSFSLRPTVLDDLGLIPALRTVLSLHAGRGGFQADFATTFRVDDPVSPDTATACFRIAQEALTNIARHASASQVHVQLLQDDHRLMLVIEDNGCGFRAAEVAAGEVSGRLGLTGMEERARLAGGEFRLQSTVGRGTEIRVALPLLAV